MKLRPIAVLTALALLTGCAAPAQATDPAPAVPQSELRPYKNIEHLFECGHYVCYGLYEDEKLLAQYGRDFREMAENDRGEAQFVPEEYKDLWLCAWPNIALGL